MEKARKYNRKNIKINERIGVRIMFEKTKKLIELPKILLELSESMLKLHQQNQEAMKELRDLGAQHIKEMCRIEESIKFRIQDIEQLYPKFRSFYEEVMNKINRLNSKADEIERKITNMDYKR